MEVVAKNQYWKMKTTRDSARAAAQKEALIAGLWPMPATFVTGEDCFSATVWVLGCQKTPRQGATNTHARDVNALRRTKLRTHG